MKQLFHIEWKRRLTSAIYLGGMILMILYDLSGMAWTRYGYEVSISYFLFQTLPIICLCIAINTALVIGQELDHRTINNKLFCGYSKQDFYKVEVLAGLLEGAVMQLVDIAVVLALGIICRYSWDVSVLEFLANLVFAIILCGTVSILSTVLAIAIGHGVFSLLVVSGLTILFLYAGHETVQTLIQPPKATWFGTDGRERDNPLYVEGPLRTLHEAHLSASPYAQAYYMPYAIGEEEEDKRSTSLIFAGFPYHLEFAIFDLAEVVLLFYAGSWYFRKKDLA